MRIRMVVATIVVLILFSIGGYALGHNTPLWIALAILGFVGIVTGDALAYAWRQRGRDEDLASAVRNRKV